MICPNCKREAEGDYCSSCKTLLMPEENSKKQPDETREEDTFHSSDRRERKRSRARREPDRKPLKKAVSSAGIIKKEKRVKSRSISFPRFQIPGWIAKICGRAAQLACALIMVKMALFLGAEFWEGREGLGAVRTMISERNFSLASYLALAGAFLLLTCISALWILTRRHFASKDRVISADLGRGMTAFLFLAAASRALPMAEEFLKGQALLPGTERFFDIMLPQTEFIWKLSLAGFALCAVRRLLKA